MKLVEARKLARNLKKIFDKEMWDIWYRIENYKLPERLWRWEVVLEFKGAQFFRPTVLEFIKLERPFKINFTRKEVVTW